MEPLKIIKLNKKDIVIPDYIMRSMEEASEDIEGLSSSIASIGMINEIDVRLIDGRYELIAGLRRFLATKEDEIMAKIFEDISVLDAMLYGLTENIQRKDTNVRDAYIYKVWKKGKDEGKFKYLRDLSSKIGMSEKNLSTIILAGDTKEKTQSPIIKKATSWDIERTKSLADHPDIREKLLKKEQDGQLTTEGLERMSKEIKSEIDKGTEKNVFVKVLELTDKTIKKSVNKYLESNVSATSSIIYPESTPEKVDRVFSDALKTYKESPEDVRKQLEKGEIDVQDAKILKKFDTIDRRNKIFKEINKIEESKKISDQVHDWDKKTIVETRLKQQEDINKTGETDFRTRFDIEDEKKFKKENNEDIHDEKYLDRYQRLSSYSLETFENFHPRRLRTEAGKRKVSTIIRNLYYLYYKVLVDIGEIKEIRPGENDNSIRKLMGDTIS